MSEKILAVSAGHEITEKEFNELLATYPPEQQKLFDSLQAKDELLEQLIAFYLFAKMAEDEKIKESKAYKDTIAKMADELASHMAATSVIEKVTLDEAEAKAFFESNKDQFVADEQVSAKHILVDSEEKAKEIAKEIAAGKAFEDAAREYSTCPSKEKGGDLGYFSKGRMMPEFEKASFEAKVGEVIGPVKTQFGYHLILVEDKKAPHVVDFSEVKEQLSDQLLQQKKQTVYAEKVKELEAKYGVERK